MAMAMAMPSTLLPSSIDALRFLSLYLFLAVSIFLVNPDGFSVAVETFPAIDALYFSVNTLCTVGYRDITPLTPLTRILTCVLALVGFGIIRPVLTFAVVDFLDAEERSLLADAHRNGLARKYFARKYFFDFKNGRLHTSLKVVLATGTVVLSIGSGMVGFYFLEDFDLVDSFYLSVVSVTTVGYGSRAFKTLPGRMFASVWLLIATLAFARGFLFLVKAMLHPRDLTVRDHLSAADTDHNGSTSISPFICKLKEMAEASEEDILNLYKQCSTGNA